VAVICADTHLHRLTWVNRRSIAGDAFHAFSYITKWCIEHKIPHMIVAGDLLETSQPDSAVMQFLARQADYLKDQNVELLFIQGQHGFSDPAWPTVSTWPWHIDQSSDVWLAEDNIRTYGLDFRSRTDLQAALKEIPKDTDVLICHQVWEEFMGGICPCEGSFRDVPGHVKLLITGDYHKTICKTYQNKDGNDMLVVSPGSTHIREISEDQNKYFFVLYDDMSVKKKVIPTRMKIDSKQIITELDLDGFCTGASGFLMDMEDHAIESKLPEELHKPLVWVHYSIELENAYHRITQAVGDRGHLFLKELLPEAEEVTEVVREERRRQRDAGLLGCLPLAVDDGDEPELYADLERLVTCSDVTAELQGMKQEALDGEIST